MPLNHKLVLSASWAQLAVRLIYGAKGSLLPPPPAGQIYQVTKQGEIKVIVTGVKTWGSKFRVMCCEKKIIQEIKKKTIFENYNSIRLGGTSK